MKNGHKLDDIKEYTIRQFQEFLYAIDTIKKQEMLGDFIVATISAQGDDKAIKKLRAELDPNARQEQNIEFFNQFVDN